MDLRETVSQEQIEQLRRDIDQSLALMKQAKNAGDLENAELHRQRISHKRTVLSGLLKPLRVF